MSLLELMISDLEGYIDNCTFQPLSETTRIVNSQHLEDLLPEFGIRTPEEGKKSPKSL
jgi:hypothetical protein